MQSHNAILQELPGGLIGGILAVWSGFLVLAAMTTTVRLGIGQAILLEGKEEGVMKLTAAILTATIVMTLAGTATGQSDGSATMNQAVGVWKIVERTIYLVEFSQGRVCMAEVTR